MKLSRAFKIKVFKPMIISSFWTSFDGRYRNRAIVYVGTTKLFFRVEKIDGTFRMWIFILDKNFCDSYTVKYRPSRPSRDDCYEEFFSFLDNNQELGERVFGHRIGSFWDYPKNISYVRGIISVLQVNALLKRTVWAGYRE